MRRLEAKYLVRVDDLPAIRLFLNHVMAPDPNVPARSTGYRVSSIYFDTKGLLDFTAKLDGEARRKKIRLRWYGGGKQVLVLEKKDKDFDEIWKSKSVVELEIPTQSLTPARLHVLFTATDNEDLQPFVEDIRTRRLRPKVCISYFRQAWIGRDYRYLRVTIDTEVESQFLSTIAFNSEAPRRYALDPRLCILEIKTEGSCPDWLSMFIKTRHLARTSVSKYCEGIKVAMGSMA